MNTRKQTYFIFIFSKHGNEMYRLDTTASLRYIKDIQYILV